MKKYYLSPETETVRLSLEAHILQESEPNGSIPGTIPSNPIINENF